MRTLALGVAALAIVGTSVSAEQLRQDPATSYMAESKCHEELYKVCGTQLHKLKAEIEEVSILGILYSSYDTAACILENMKDIAKACSPLENEQVSKSAPLANNAVMPSPAFSAQASPMLTEESRCHKALYQYCGDELNSLKKAIQDTSPTGIAGSALEIAGCVTKNFVVLVEACSPFKNEMNKRSNMMAQVPMPPGQPPMVAEFLEDVQSSHFDFNDCVEMAKMQIFREASHHHFHRHGFFALAVLILVGALSFFKGFRAGKRHQEGSCRHPCFFGKIRRCLGLESCPEQSPVTAKMIPSTDSVEKVDYIQVTDGPAVPKSV